MKQNDHTIFKISWRNIWRNRLRSSIIILAVTVGIFGGLVSTGIMKGMVMGLINNSLENQTSHIQIHNKQFVENNEVGFLMNKTDKLLSKISKEPAVKSVCERTKTFGMASTASKSAGIMVNGIDPVREKTVTGIWKKIVKGGGTYFESNKRNRIVISEKLAKKLKARIKSKIVITFQDYDGNLTGASFKVEGIYRTQNSMFDKQNVFVRKTDLDKLLNMPSHSAHEIAIVLKNYKQTGAEVERIKRLTPDYLVQGWPEIDPYLQVSASMVDFMLYIFMLIILIALGFAIVNTMLMVILERTKELGMIMAIGMNKFKVFKMIFYETTLLGIIGALVGIVISAAFTLYFGRYGIDISIVGKGFEAMGYGTVMKPYLELTDYFQVLIMVIITGLIASVFPTIRALKMKPVEAIRD